MGTGILRATAWRFGAVISMVFMSSGVYADDESCIGVNYAAAKVDLQKAYALEKQGKLADAFKLADGEAHCAGGRDLVERVGPVLGRDSEAKGLYEKAYYYFGQSLGNYDDARRVARKAAAGEEKKGNLKKAIEWYYSASDEQDAVRLESGLKMASVRSKPTDTSLFGVAFGYVENHAKEYPDIVGGYQKELRQIATTNADSAFAQEDKKFSAGLEGLEELDDAKDWLRYTNSEKRALARAESRADSLADGVSRKAVERSIHYYDYAENKQQAQKMRSKAVTLGEGYEKKGQYAVAAIFYDLGGEGDRAESLTKNKEAEHEKSEEKRQKEFSKEQDDLEKELGL